MGKKSIMSGMILTIVIMIVLLVISEGVSIIVEFMGEEVISPSASIAIDLFVMVIAIVVAVVGLYSHTKEVRQTIETMNGYVERIASGDVDWDVPEGRYKEYTGFIECMRRLLHSTKVQTDMANLMSKGDFTVDSHVRGEKDVLGKALKALAEENNMVLCEVQEASMSFTEGAKEVAAASQALAQGSTEQASAIEQITASVKDIATKTATNAEDARNMENMVQEMLEEAEAGKKAVEGVNNSMNEINDSSHNISKVIKTIDDIAFQTSILALNATVEAARAGVHGRGFAVVAEEVKNLAELSSNAAKETAELIQHAIAMVDGGTKQVDEMTIAITKISEAIEAIVDIVSEVAASSDEQATAISQVKLAIGQISQVVQTDSATSEECAAAADMLSSHAHNLRDVVSGFKLKGGSAFGNKMGGYSAPSMSSYSSKSSFDSSFDNVDNESIISLNSDMGKY